MKRTLVVLAFVTLFIPSVSFASDAEIKTTILQNLLVQFTSQVNAIDAMQKEVAKSSNPAQFKSFSDVLRSQLDFTTKALAALLNNEQPVAPVVSQPIFSGNSGNGTVNTMPEEDKSELKVTLLSRGTPENIGFPFGSYNYAVSVLGQDGKYRNDVTIHMDSTTDDIYFGKEQYMDRTPNGVTSSDLKDYYATFSYIPTTAGTKTITFTAGSLSKSITVEVE